MNRDVLHSTGRNAVRTPRLWFRRWNIEAGGFVADMAALADNARLPAWYGPDHPDRKRRNALAVDWPTHGPVWCNPPYGEARSACPPWCESKTCEKLGSHLLFDEAGCIDFVEKAATERLRGVTTWMLVASRTDVEWFHRFVWDRRVSLPRPGIVCDFLEGRLTFEGERDPAPFPSLLIKFLGGPAL